jgi:hypothetical protein
MAQFIDNHDYRKLRQNLVALTQGAWHVYYVGNLAAARRAKPNADLVARLTFGLAHAGIVRLAQKRNIEGIVEYRLFTVEKIGDEDLDAAMVLTSKKGDAHVSPIPAE